MPAKPPRPIADVLAELTEELARGKVYEGALLSKGFITYGLCDYETGAVHVDPIPHLVEVLLHELTHRRYPSWSERRVDREAHRLVSGMTRTQLRTWHRRFLKVAKHRRPLRTDDEDAA